MAYNNGFPMGFNYYQQPMMQQPQMQIPQQPMMQMQQQPMQQQAQQPVQQLQYPVLQQGGFVRVRNENEARTYFVAPGNSVTFIDENSNYIFTKTVNMGQLDRPIFEKYRLVKEDDDTAPQQPVEQPQKPVETPQIDVSQFITKDILNDFRADLDAIKADLETFRNDLYGIAGKKKSTPIKKEVVNDD